METAYKMIGRSLVVMFVWALAFVPVLAEGSVVKLLPLAGHTGEYLILDAIDPASPVTLQTRFRIESKEGLAALKGLWIAGLSESPDAPPTALSLVWSEEPSGWFPVWGLQLQSDAGFFASGVSTKRGAGLLQGSSYITAHTLTPQVGHVYQAELSYDPQAGRVAVGVSDLTTGNRLFTRAVALQPTNTTLYPAVGIVGGGYGVHFEQVTVSPYSVPVGLTWDLMANESDGYARLAVFRLTQGYDLALRLGTDVQDLAGTFTLAVDDGAETQPLLEYAARARRHDLILPFAAAQLPLGDITLSLNYTDEGGQVWTLGARPLLVVAATVDINFGPLIVDNDTLHGTVTLKSLDEAVFDLPFRILAAIGAPDQKDGETELILEERLAYLSPEPSVVRFTIPIDFAERLFSVVLDIDFDVPVGKVMQGNQYHVLLAN